MDTSTISNRNRTPGFFWCFSSCCLWERPRVLSMVETNKTRWRDFGYKSGNHVLPPTFAFLIDLYDGKDVLEGLESCRINPDFSPDNHMRNDLEYYIPQLTNFMVFHEDFLCKQLTSFLEEASRADPYFAHSYYWYINSLLSAIDQEKAQTILTHIVEECSVEPQTQLFVPHYEKFISALQKKLTKEELEAKLNEIEYRKSQAQAVIQSYKADDLNLNMPNFKIKGLDIELESYHSPYTPEQERIIPNSFNSTITFYEDLAIIADELTRKSILDKPSYLKTSLHALNKLLPSCIYTPFVKDSIRYYALLNIVVDETKVFSTKERAPFYVCFEIFRPQEELGYEYNELFPQVQEIKTKKKKKFIDWSKIKKTFTMKPKKKKVKDFRRESRYEKDADEQFKVSKINELVSSPLTLKRLFRSHEGVGLIDPKFKRQSSLSMVVHSQQSYLDLLHQEEFKSSENKLTNKPLQPVRRLSKVRNSTVEEEDGIGIAIAYQEDGSLVSSSDANNSKENKSEPSSFLNNKSSSFKDSIPKPEPGFSTSLNEPLLEEEKEGDSKQNSEKDLAEKDPAERLHIASMLSEQDIYDFFGEDSQAQAKRIRECSPFKNLKTWKLVHVIFKSGADMKEEQFAIQLISQFDQIFKDEKVKLILTPYEIISLGGDFGVMEVVKDAITISRLKEKMYRRNITTLNEFFAKYYGEEVEKARKRFCRSLAAYSLVCYFLQIKDRHNGNILFHKLGHILHIDFGFLLSNSPGKGLEFERKVPFKLLNEYVEVLGGPRSSLFQEFRKLFYRGFMAARKHKEQILILVKMMYSTQGTNLPCFKAGIRAIVELEQRFDPPGVHERDLMGYCYNLINQSLDNWRAKCYDKYQYHFQGIFY